VTGRSRIDLERFLRSVVTVKNSGGGRGYDAGVRVFDCPLCGDHEGRGWVGTTHWQVGCFKVGCQAEPRLPGGVIEWARVVLGLQSRADVWRHLEREFGGGQTFVAPPLPPRGPDFCRYPSGMRRFDPTPSPMQVPFEDFVQRQWGLSAVDARSWGLGWCLHGHHAHRVIIPVLMGGEPVGFQARTVGHAGPKYLTSSSVATDRRPAECGRPAAAMLFNLDSLPEEGTGLLVEGPGDVMGWHRGDRGRSPTAVALLGVALTPAKLAMIAARRPELVVVALDDEPAARRRGLGHVEDLIAWDVPAEPGRWVGRKDAGSGASLLIEGRAGPGDAVRARVG
jgi:hypothetical protein